MNKGIKDTEAAELLGVAPQTMRNWRFLGKGPAYLRLGEGERPAIRYLIEDLHKYMESKRIVPEECSHLA